MRRTGHIRRALLAGGALTDSCARGMTRVAGLVFLGAAVLIGFDVLARNFLGTSTQASIELSGYMLAIGVAWGLGGALDARTHIRVDVLVQRVAPGARRYLHAVALAALLLFAGAIAYGAVELAGESWLFGSTDISALAVPLVIPQGIWAFGFAFFLLMVAVRFLHVLSLLPTGSIEAVEQLTGPRGYVEEAQEALDALPDDPASRARAG